MQQVVLQPVVFSNNYMPDFKLIIEHSCLSQSDWLLGVDLMHLIFILYMQVHTGDAVQQVHH